MSVIYPREDPRTALPQLEKRIAELEEKAKDYVVEQGTDGIWTYRKWNSGVMEAWGYSADSYAMTTAIGSMYYGNKTYTISQLGFTEVNNLQITGGASGHYLGSKFETFNTNTFSVSARASASNTATIAHSFYIKGTWK